MTHELMYNTSSILIVLILFGVILLTHEIGFRLGLYFHHKSDDLVRAQTNTIQTGTLGLLALLLGFTFNMALQRYDARSHAVIKEANAIETAMLRAKLLPNPHDSISSLLLQEYLELRIEASSLDLTKEGERNLIKGKTDSIQNKIWELSVKLMEIDSGPRVAGYFMTSFNEMCDIRDERNAILQNHIPEVILFLLFLVFIIHGGLMGYSNGLIRKRITVASMILTLLIVLVVFIVIDLDRPKRGLIRVNQESLIRLKN